VIVVVLVVGTARTSTSIFIVAVSRCFDWDGSAPMTPIVEYCRRVFSSPSSSPTASTEFVVIVILLHTPNLLVLVALVRGRRPQ
jgi:hypothetical protein